MDAIYRVDSAASARASGALRAGATSGAPGILPPGGPRCCRSMISLHAPSSSTARRSTRPVRALNAPLTNFAPTIGSVRPFNRCCCGPRERPAVREWDGFRDILRKNPCNARGDQGPRHLRAGAASEVPQRTIRRRQHAADQQGRQLDHQPAIGRAGCVVGGLRLSSPTSRKPTISPSRPDF